MYSTMNVPWSNVPPAPGTQGYGYPQSQSLRLTASRGLTSRSHAYNAADAPAYHPVQVRQSFNTPAMHYAPVIQQPVQTLPPPAPRKKIEWPQPVRNYVQRSFDENNMLSDVSRSDMEIKLKQTITEATDQDTLDKIDWDNLPLPQQLIKQERQQARAITQQPASLTSRNSSGFISGRENMSKKRKSQEIDEDSTPPWRATNNRNPLEDRMTLDKRPQPTEDSHKGISKAQKNLEKRQRRFDGGYKTSYQPEPSPEPTSGPVVGTCQTLEKRYFRLTSAPIPSQVRPEYILRQTLDLLKKKWKKENNYSYICDQFKSMRQDLTVQRIRNDFTVNVYEIHARIALEKGDLGEYNQCQTQLRALYAQNLGGNPVEFKAYRILYFIHTSNRTALNDILTDLTIAEKGEEAIKHALDVRSALALGNYHRFFRLYLDTPNMGAYLMDMFVVRERLAALSNICKA
jgi:hypothetical protein